MRGIFRIILTRKEIMFEEKFEIRYNCFETKKRTNRAVTECDEIDF